jgi:hypothetical protein
MVEAWVLEGVRYVGVVGVDASRIEDIIDELCVGDGSSPYFMLTAAHDSTESVEDAVMRAESITDIIDPGAAGDEAVTLVGPVDLIEF